LVTVDKTSRLKEQAQELERLLEEAKQVKGDVDTQLSKLRRAGMQAYTGPERRSKPRD
jgi:hypothetical protein